MILLDLYLGGDEGDRTPGLGVANAALSQLSYIPKPINSNRKTWRSIYYCQYRCQGFVLLCPANLEMSYSCLDKITAISLYSPLISARKD